MAKIMSQHPVARTALVAPSSPLRLQTEINDIAKSKAFRRIFEKYCGADVLPTDKPMFTKEEAPLYIEDRTPPTGLTASDEYYYEKQLDRNFWNHEETRRIMFIEGGRGTGKSTLTDFYLRCYCPTISSNKEKFKEKLTIQVNAAAIKTDQLFREKFFPRMATSILRRCRERSYPINEVVREFVSELGGSQSGKGLRYDNHPKEWCEAALSAISRKIENRDPYTPFRYLVLAIDNLDQTTLPVQTIVLDYICDWINRNFGFMLWRVYLPMWPETVRSLLDANALRHLKQMSDTITLGTIPRGLVINRRNYELFEHIRHKSAIPQISPDSENTDFFKDGKISCDQCCRYVSETHKYYHDTFGDFLEDLTNGDLRKQLEIRDNAMSGRTAFHFWANSRAIRVRSFIPYDVLDSILTGKSVCYDPRSSQVANMYGFTRRTSAMGPHVLHLLSSNETLTFREFSVYLTSLGYSDAEVEAAHNLCFEANMFHHLAGHVQNTELIIHSACVRRYSELLVEPAYLDNAALITPVKPEVYSKLKVTSILRVADLRARIESTIAFMEMIRDDEVSFNAALRRRYIDLSLELDAQERLKSRIEMVPRLQQSWKQIALRYVERLANLRTYFTNTVIKDAGMSEEAWRTLLDSRIFSDAQSCPDLWPYPWEDA